MTLRAIQAVEAIAAEPDWMAPFLASLARDDLASATLRGYRYDLRHFLNWHQSVQDGTFAIKSLAEYELIAYRQHMVAAGLRPATINRRLDALRRLCRWAQGSGALEVDAARNVRPVRTVRNQQPVGLTDIEVHALLRAAGASLHGLAARNYAMAQLMLQAGLRLAASLKDRLTPAHVVMQRLVNANASDRLAGALSQLGRLMKTLHILRYIQEEPLRDAIQLQLNRGEFRHILAKSLFFANQGSFRSGDYEEVMNKASSLSLLSNAVLVWNTVHIARIVDQLRATGHEVKDEDLARVSPLAHAHVIPNGSYFQSPRRRTGAVPETAMA
jgi:hypothetical protein